MYDELIKNLRKVESGEYCAVASTEDFPVMQFVKDAADAIEELQKDLERSKDFEAFWQHEAEEALKKFQVAISNKSRWIPVTERLPLGTNLVFAVANGEVVIAIYGNYKWVEAKTYAEFYPTHWMPLPQPPKEEHDDKA